MKFASPLWPAFVLATLILEVAPNAAAQNVVPCDTPNNLPSSFFEVEKGPQGDWSATVMPDLQQANDPNVPVVVAGAGAIQGPVNQRGLRLGCGLLKNRSQKRVTSVQLRWILARMQDRSAIAQQDYTPNTVLLEGHSLAIELSIQKESFRRTDFSIISFAAVTQKLLKDGILSGGYCLIIGVNEVLFEDGSTWNVGMLFGWLNSWPAVQLTSNVLVSQREEGAPVNCTQPATDQGALIHEAEKGRFTLRRMELIGNVSTPDDLLHSRIASRMEVGNLFTRHNLVASMKNVSRLKTIYPVTMKNIVVELNPAEKTLNLRICIRDRPQSVRRAS